MPCAATAMPTAASVSAAAMSTTTMSTTTMSTTTVSAAARKSSGSRNSENGGERGNQSNPAFAHVLVPWVRVSPAS
jgi:hypothetical protein